MDKTKRIAIKRNLNWFINCFESNSDCLERNPEKESESIFQNLCLRSNFALVSYECILRYSYLIESFFIYKNLVLLL